MSNKEQSSIFEDKTYGIRETNGVNGVLSRLWRTILYENNINFKQFTMMLNENAIRFKNSVNDSRVAKVMSSSNVRRSLESPNMTWKVFIRGMRVLKIRHMTITITLTSSTGKKTVHETAVDLGTPPDINEFLGV